MMGDVGCSWHLPVEAGKHPTFAGQTPRARAAPARRVLGAEAGKPGSPGGGGRPVQMAPSLVMTTDGEVTWRCCVLHSQERLMRSPAHADRRTRSPGKRRSQGSSCIGGPLAAQWESGLSAGSLGAAPSRAGRQYRGTPHLAKVLCCSALWCCSFCFCGTCRVPLILHLCGFADGNPIALLPNTSDFTPPATCPSVWVCLGEIPSRLWEGRVERGARSSLLMPLSPLHPTGMHRDVQGQVAECGVCRTTLVVWVDKQCRPPEGRPVEG